MYEFTSCFYVFMCHWEPHISHLSSLWLQHVQLISKSVIYLKVSEHSPGQSSEDLEFGEEKNRRKLGHAVVIFTSNCSFLPRVCRVVPLNQA